MKEVIEIHQRVTGHFKGDGMFEVKAIKDIPVRVPINDKREEDIETSGVLGIDCKISEEGFIEPK